MKPDIKIIRAALVIVLLLATLVLILYIFVIEKDESASNPSASKTADIYFYDANSISLKAEERQVQGANNAEKVKYVLEELALGPKNSALKHSVPFNMIKSAQIVGDNVNVSLTSDYYRLDNTSEIICRTSLVRTLTSLDFVGTVSVNVEGKEIQRSDSTPFGKMKSGDFVMSPEVYPRGESTKTLVLYFEDKQTGKLMPESRTVSVNPNEPIIKYIANEIIKGPLYSTNLRKSVSKDTKLLEITKEDGLCCVDLSKDFLVKRGEGYADELMVVYSFVNSLCEESDVKSVQFLIEGVRVENFNSLAGFNNPFEADYDMLAAPRK